MKNQCCKDCVDRHIGCHMDCERYGKFRAEIDAINARRRLDTELKDATYKVLQARDRRRVR